MIAEKDTETVANSRPRYGFTAACRRSGVGEISVVLGGEALTGRDLHRVGLETH